MMTKGLLIRRGPITGPLHHHLYHDDGSAGTVSDPNVSNNSAQVDIDVIDKNDF
jgi:hypothetical protein